MKIKLALLIAALAFVMSSCSFSANTFGNKPTEKNSFMMGTFITQRVYGAKADEAIDEVWDRIRAIEGLMTINADGGDVNRLNEAAGYNSVTLDAETIRVLAAARKYAELTEGVFDVTIGPIVKAWGIFTDKPRIPEQAEIDKLLKLVDYKALHIDTGSMTAKLEIPGQIADLGGIAKGYAGDVARDIYKKYGIESAYINLGGNVAVLGPKPDGSPWKIAIQNPRAENGVYIGTVDIVNKAIVTSGDYERYFVEDGIRYHHIIDTTTGYPAESGLISASIITEISMDADALSTSVFAMGLEKGMKLVESLDGVEAILVTKDKEVYATSGIKSSFNFSDPSKEFKYVEEG